MSKQLQWPRDYFPTIQTKILYCTQALYLYGNSKLLLQQQKKPHGFVLSIQCAKDKTGQKIKGYIKEKPF